MNFKKYRSAFWEHYEGRCFYCEKLIQSYSDATIDHIIPQNNFEACGIKLKQKRTYELPNDFSKDSFSNLVLSCQRCNRNWKGPNAFNEKSELFFILIAQSKSEKIQQQHQKFLALRNKLLLDASIMQFDAPKERKFEEQNKLYLDQYHCFFIRSTQKIYVYSHLPSLKSIKGNCIVDFYDGKTMWSLMHEQIKELFNFDSVEGLKHFLTRGIDAKKGVFATFGTIAEFYSEDLFEDLALVLFSLAVVYKRQYDAVLTEMEILPEDFSDITQMQYLETIDRDLWNAMLKMTEQYQEDDGDSRWHVFAHTTSFITIMSEDGHCIAARVFPGKSDDPSWESYKWTDSEVDIFWKFEESKNHIEKDSGILTAKQTKEFIVDYSRYVKSKIKINKDGRPIFYSPLENFIRKIFNN